MYGRPITPRRFGVWAATASLALGVWIAAQSPCAKAEQPRSVAADQTKRDSAPGGNRGTNDQPASADIYLVPKTDNVDELMRFIVRIERFTPHSVEEQIEDQKRAPLAIKAAAERILKVEKNKSSTAYQSASMLLLSLRVAQLSKATPTDQRATIDEVVRRISGLNPSREDFGLAMMVTDKLEELEDTQLASEAYTAFAKAFKASDVKEIAGIGEHFTGAARRLGLIGNSMKVAGRTTADKPLDWKQYQGKVVLVDFWATWCKPCVAEIPNLRRAYREYHDRGFDIVGVSVDDDDSQLDSFLDEAKVPWTIVRDKDAFDPKSHPLSDYYGISRFPTMMLLNQEGKVVTFDARGEQLWVELERLIGPPSRQPAVDGKPSAKQAGAVKTSTQPAGTPKGK